MKRVIPLMNVYQVMIWQNMRKKVCVRECKDLFSTIIEEISVAFNTVCPGEKINEIYSKKSLMIKSILYNFLLTTGASNYERTLVIEDFLEKILESHEEFNRFKRSSTVSTNSNNKSVRSDSGRKFSKKDKDAQNSVEKLQNFIKEELRQCDLNKILVFLDNADR